MITPQTAKRLIARHAARLKPTWVPLAASLGHVLAADVRSRLDLPRFDNSAMDGFALRADDTRSATRSAPARLAIAFTVHAGDPARVPLSRGAACRIMTGARLPRGADAILPKEHARVEGSVLVIETPVARLRHVRPRGEDIGKGARVLRRGDVIHPGTVAVLAAVGAARVRVVRKPAVAVITTGDEAMPLGTRLGRGQIYDSNSHMMVAILKGMGIDRVWCRHVNDRPALLSNAIRRALSTSDVIIAVGGASVGDRDYLRPVLQQEGVRKVFWQVAQKPGKPLYFGVRGKKLIFGLPGNPASAFTCFYVYVYPALRRMSGFSREHLAVRLLRPSDAVNPDKTKWRFVRARSEKTVTPLGGQGSHMVKSLAGTNSFIVVPPGTRARRDELETCELPHAEDV